MFSKKIIIALLLIVVIYSPVTAKAVSTEDLQSQINILLSLVTSVQQKILEKTTEVGTSTKPIEISISPSECSILITRNLYVGENDAQTNGEVSKLQGFLTETGDFNGNITGYFGSLTEQAVQSWQRKNGIVTSGSPNTTGYGVVGPITRRAMNDTFCRSKYDKSQSSILSKARIKLTPDSGLAPTKVKIKLLIPRMSEDGVSKLKCGKNKYTLVFGDYYENGEETFDSQEFTVPAGSCRSIKKLHTSHTYSNCGNTEVGEKGSLCNLSLYETSSGKLIAQTSFKLMKLDVPTPTPPVVPTPVPPTPTPPVDTVNIDFIKDAYQLFLDRTVDNAGLQNWETKLNNRNITHIGLLWTLTNSKEFLNKNTKGVPLQKISKEDYIKLLYSKILHRPEKDTLDGGQKNWVNKMDIELTRKCIFEKILLSEESKNKNKIVSFYNVFPSKESLCKTPTPTPPVNTDNASLITGLDFLNGIIVQQVYPVQHVEVARWFPFGNSEASMPNIWRLAQWYSKYQISNVVPIKNSDGSVTYKNNAKSITFNKDKSFILESKGTTEYPKSTGKKRGANWPHLLLSQSTLPLKNTELISTKNNVEHDQIIYLKNLEKLIFKLDYDLISRSAIPRRMNKKTQTVQDLVTLVVQNRNPNSSQYGDFYWLNITLHDARYGCTPVLKRADAGTSKFMYSPSSCDLFKSKYTSRVISPTDNQWKNIKIDKNILPILEKGFKLAKKSGKLQGTNFEDLALSSVSIGHEVTAAMDIKSKYKNIQFIPIKK